MPPARIALWLASLAGIALLVRSLWFEPVPMEIAVSAMLGYVALCTAGLILPWLEMFGDAVSKAEPGPRLVALTFDDGPYPPTTRKVLDHLSEADQKATFFVLAAKAKKYPELIKEIHEAGHEIAMHGFRHDRLYAWRTPKQVQEDIAQCEQVLEPLTQTRPRWFRPPMGMVSPRTAAGARKAKVEVVAWSVRAYDGLESSDPERVRTRIEGGLRDGAIVLMHDAAESDDFEPASIKVLPDVLKALAARGLRSVTMSELFGGSAEAEGAAASADEEPASAGEEPDSADPDGDAPPNADEASA